MSIAALDIPQGVSSDGTVSALYVPGGLASTTPPSLAAATGNGSQDLSCYIFAFGEGADQATKQKRRLCQKQSYTLLGPVTPTIDEIQYVYDVQNPDSETHAAYAALVPHSTGHLIVRWGIDSSVPWAVGDIVDIYPVRLGVQRKLTPEENDELMVAQQIAVIGNKVTDVALAA